MCQQALLIDNTPRSLLLPLLPLLRQVGRHISHYISAKEGSHPYRVRLAELGSGTMLQVRTLGVLLLLLLLLLPLLLLLLRQSSYHVHHTYYMCSAWLLA
jgi:hypothetical protein